MAAPATANEFLDLVRKSGVLDAQQFAELFPDGGDLPAEPQACANALVKAGLLTQYQARQMLAGKFRGFVLGAYKILQPVGRGGMGAVFLAEHTDLKRRVAVKVLPADKANDKLSLERFYREARAAAALDHPNIVRLYDISQGAGVHFLVMEFVEGKDLQSLMATTGPLHYAQAAHYVAQAAAGLQHAHEKGFVHRDVKPSNLILAKDGTVKILDMGLARTFGDKADNLTGLLGDNEVLGTADYVSPEQALNQPVDERSDVYSLGATFFALITGHPPFKGSTTQVLAQHQAADPPQLSKRLKVAVPPALNDVVARMMAKKKSDRYQSAADVIDALSPWLPATPSGNIVVDPLSTTDLRAAGARTLGTRSSGSRFVAAIDLPLDQKKWLLIGGGVGLGLLVLLTIILIAAFGPGSKGTPAAQNPGPGLTTPPPFIGPGQSQPWRASGVPFKVVESQALTGHGASINDTLFSPTGQRLASVDWDGTIIVWDAKTGQQVQAIQATPGHRLLACVNTPDGQGFLVVGDKTPVLVLDWQTGQTVREYPGHDGTTWGVAISPDGKLLATCGNDGLVTVRDYATGDVVRQYEFETKTVWCVAFSPDGTKLAAASGSGSGEDDSFVIRVWNTADGKQLHRLTGHTKDVRWLAFRPDGRTLASAGFDGTVRLWDLSDGKELRTIHAHDGYVERVYFLPGGKRMITCGGPLSKGQMQGEGGALKVWDPDTGREVRVWRGAECYGLIGLALSPDGLRAATGDRDKVVQLWKLPAP